MKIIKINIDNTMENINIDNINNTNILEELIKLTNYKGLGDITELYSWNKNKIKAYGWVSSGTEHLDQLKLSQHKLPPCGSSIINIDFSEDVVLYGNIFIISFNKNNKVTNYDISEYGELHYILTTDDFDKEYNHSESDEELDLTKINTIKIKNTEYINNGNDNLLDEDLTEYK